MRKAALVVLLLAIPLAFALSPSEVLYNPAGSDNGLEFIELSGDEDLTGCVVRDTASQDTLDILQAGSGIILVVESDGIYANMTTDAVVYGAGAAIGNGLGNTAETVTISCNGTDLLTIAYNASLVTVPDGASIVWRDNAWVAGTVGGTPGVGETPPDTIPETTAPAAPMVEEACNTTLLITVGATEGLPGDVITFTVVSADYAAWEALTDDGMIAYGDTLASRTHAITLPHGATDVRLMAESRACGGRQRATRHLSVRPPMVNETANATAPVAASAPPEPVVPERPAAVPKEPVTGRVIVDDDGSAVPWIAAFGIVTVITSSIVFIAIHRRENAGSDEAKYISPHVARHDDGQRAADPGAPEGGLDTGDRDVRGGGAS